MESNVSGNAMRNHDTTPQSDSAGEGFAYTFRAIIAVAFAAALTVAGLLCVPTAMATPGQCWSSPFGGFCDQLPAADGSFMHCEQTGFGSSSYRNCYQACLDGGGRLYPTDYRFDTPC